MRMDVISSLKLNHQTSQHRPGSPFDLLPAILLQVHCGSRAKQATDETRQGDLEMGPRHLINAMLRLSAFSAVVASALGLTSGEAADVAKGQAAFVRQCA